MRGSTTISITDFNAAAAIIEEAGNLLSTLDEVPMTAAESKMLGEIEVKLLDLAIAMRKRLDLSAA